MWSFGVLGCIFQFPSQVSGLKQSVFGGESLHALPLQELHGSPVDLCAVFWPAKRSHLLLDVLQPQVFGKKKERMLHFKHNNTV